MAFHTYKIEHYSKESDGSYTSTSTVISDVQSISVNLAAGESADSFSFTVVNNDNNDGVRTRRLNVHKSRDTFNIQYN